jgi:hypothetical protein
MKNALLILALVTSICSCAFETRGQKKKQQSTDPTFPSWTKKTGARPAPKRARNCSVHSHGGATNSTAAIQKAINECSKSGGGIVTFGKGEYVTGALFLKNNVDLRVSDGVTLLGSQDDSDYPRAPTRVAGIEMTWPSALINVNDAKNVKISGAGTIDGGGKKWWDKYWALRREYEPKGLRWASDYDAERVRLIGDQPFVGCDCRECQSQTFRILDRADFVFRSRDDRRRQDQ